MNKEKILQILNDWNFWDKDLSAFVERTDYANNIAKFAGLNEIIVLKGVRRAGKSTLFFNIIQDLFKQGVTSEEILLINFEDPRLANDLSLDLFDQIWETYREYINNSKKPYVFLDEIQNVEKWEKWVRMMYELDKAHLYVTGSSSKLLSKEFGTALAGRYLATEVFPLSFAEYLAFNKIALPKPTELITQKIKYKKHFNQYLKKGGFPKVVLTPSEYQQKELQSYYETIILKDIVARYNLKNYDNVKKVSLYLLSNIGKTINLNNIKNAVNVSYDLVEKYFEYLKDTYLIFELLKYDYSLKKQLRNLRKIYAIDNALINAVSFSFSENTGRLLENSVFLELKRQEKEIYYHQDKSECDFVVKQGNKIKEAIQVTHSLSDEKVRKREIKGLKEAMDLYSLDQGLILTNDEEDEFLEGDKKIIVKPVWRWLLES